MHFDATAIAQATGGQVLQDGDAGPVHTDTRELGAGAWFLALVGERFDGHSFLHRADAPAGCVVERAPAAWSSGVVVVPDTTRALQDLGRAARSRLVGPVVGITGSAGKTTTRTLTALALAPLGQVHHTVGNLNNHLGVPMTLCAAPETAVATVVELGSSGPGEIAFLTALARPRVRLIVNVGPSHLLELGGLAGVAAEKAAIFATASAGDVCCVNMDDPHIARMAIPGGARVVTFGSEPTADVRITHVAVDGDTASTRVQLAVLGAPISLHLPAPGAHLALDAAAALAVAVAVGVDPVAAAASMGSYAPVGMRMRMEPLPGGVTAINDAYNANPTSMAASLQTLCSLSGRHVAVLGDMLELGEGEAALHDEVATLAATLDVDRLVLVGARMSAAQAPLPAERVVRVTDPDDAARALVGWLQDGDWVLFKGSRGARVERVLQSLRGLLSSDEESR